MFRDVEEVYGFRIDGELERVEDELDAVASLTLYRIVQEAVTNAVKHSGAGEAAVTLRTANGWIEVVGVASSGEEAVRKTRSLEPDIVVMDLAMPGMDGVQATRRIAALDLGTKVLVLTIHDEDGFLVPAMEAGAAGFLNKSAADTDLLGALEAVARGHSYLPRRAAALIARRKAVEASRNTKGIEALSERERTAVELYAKGFSAREAASEMLVSPKTVEGYIARAKAKLSLDNRRDIVRFALENGLLQTEE